MRTSFGHRLAILVVVILAKHEIEAVHVDAVVDGLVDGLAATVICFARYRSILL